jgi:ComF family protein
MDTQRSLYLRIVQAPFVVRARRASRAIAASVAALVRAIRYPSRRSLCSPSGRTDLANSIGSGEALVLNSRTIIKKSVASIIDKILLLVFPCCCTYCKRLLDRRAIFCPSCTEMIRPIVSTAMPLTQTRSMKIIALSAYQDPVRVLILAKRWSDIHAGSRLGQLIWDHTNFHTAQADYIIPIPLHWTRYSKRGFNQAEQMARVLATNKAIPMVKILKRIKKTAFQADLSAPERQANVKDVFELVCSDKEQFRNKHLVLVDDLLTTGSTITSAARELLVLKPASITVVVAARVV